MVCVCVCDDMVCKGDVWDYGQSVRSWASMELNGNVEIRDGVDDMIKAGMTMYARKA